MCPVIVMERFDRGEIPPEEAARLLKECSSMGTPAAEPTPTAPTTTPEASLPTRTPTPAGAPEPTPLEQAHLAEKKFMVELINEERQKAGVRPVVLGDNPAPQIHANSALAGCFSSHWGLDGLKPYMRYSLAGGYQSNGENGLGLDYCVGGRHRVKKNGPIKMEIEDAIESWMGSSGHRRNMLDPDHRRVNIGLAWDTYNVRFYQHFEGGYVIYESLPAIEDGWLTIKGTVTNGAKVSRSEDLSVQIYYDPPPEPLTRGQLSRTSGYDLGLRVASLRWPLGSGWFWPTHSYTTEHLGPPVDPDDVPDDAVAPSYQPFAPPKPPSVRPPPRSITVPWITASRWRTDDSEFAVVADIASVLKAHGPGVYSLIVWVPVNGVDTPISQYSIFHEVQPPGGYGK